MILFGSDETGTLELTEPRRGEAGELWWLTATLQAPGLVASTQVETHYAKGFDDLIAFFDDLAERWRPWEGRVEYDSVEHDLRMTARHDGVGHVILTVRLAGPHPPYQWSVEAEISTDPGEQMAAAAAEAHALLARES